jgi:hypothetical protein
LHNQCIFDAVIEQRDGPAAEVAAGADDRL